MTETSPETSGGAPDRYDSLSARIDQLAAQVARIVPGSHAEAQGREETRLNRPSSVEDQVRRSLAALRREEIEDAHRKETSDRLTALENAGKTRTKKAETETAPQAPPVVRPIEQLMGWK